MSGFASKLSAASAKGWTGLQSLWGEPKTTLATADTSPGEKTSLLGMGGYGSNSAGDSSGNKLLAEDEDSWGDSWAGDWQKDGSGGSSKPQKLTSDDWSAGNDEDLEAWLNEDSPYKGMMGKDKPQSSAAKKTSKDTRKSSSKAKAAAAKGSDWNDVEWDSGFTSPGKQKEPLVGNLLDLSDGDTNNIGGPKAKSGWDNEVWADEDDEWQSLDLESSKGKKSS